MAFDQATLLPHTWQQQLSLEAAMGKFEGRKEWVQSLAETGATIKKCSARYGIRRRQLTEYAQLYSVKFTSGIKITREKLAPLVARGKGVKEIAEILGFTPVGVRYALQREFPDYDPPRLRARPMHRDAAKPRPSRSRVERRFNLEDYFGLKPLIARQPVNRQPEFNPATIGPPPTPIGLFRVLAAQEDLARRQRERGFIQPTAARKLALQ